MAMNGHDMSTERDSGVPLEVDDTDTNPVAAPGQILVVDDNPGNLVVAEAALAALDRTIVSVTSGKEALAKVLDHDFALVLLDVNMPNMDGFETAKWIRSHERTKHIPIIFVTAQEGDAAAVARAYELGAVDFLIKPVVPSVLRAKASVFIQLHERTEQLATERMERQFESRRRQYETEALRRDRDREQQANRELARLNGALEQNDRRKDTFIAILAHELRNPLAPIRTCVDLMQQAPAKPPSAKMLEILDRQSSVLARLIDDLLDLSRIKQDKIELRPERIDLVDVVEAALTTCKPLVDERRHAVVFDAPTESIAAVADSVRMTQVICNLVNNAARYTPASGRIEVSCGTDGDDVFIRVRDNGIGIPAEWQNTIFDMFVQERVRTDGSGGLGLGLALARRLVAMHRGSIRVESAGRGHGSMFEVRIPQADSPRALAVRPPTRDLPAASPVETPLRAVIVDDNQDALGMLASLLETNGVEVMAAHDGRTALDLIRQHRPDVAVLDLGLPDIDGLRIVETARAEMPELPTRFIALTGYGDAADRARTKRAGFDDHLVKPATAAALLACLRAPKRS
jgi:signal transduction histidine kinase